MASLDLGTQRIENAQQVCELCKIFDAAIVSYLIYFYPFLSYRNQRIGLHYKSIEWFLYDRNIGLKWVKKLDPAFLLLEISVCLIVLEWFNPFQAKNLFLYP